MAKFFVATVLLCVFATINAETFPWMNDFLTCVTRMPIYEEEPAILEKGTYDIMSDKDEFMPGDMLTFYIDGKKQDDKYRGLFISILEDGRSVGEWMPSKKFRMLSCNGRKNSAMTEMSKDMKYVQCDGFRWKAPACDQSKNYELTATVIRADREFQKDIKLGLKCMGGAAPEAAPEGVAEPTTSPEGEPSEKGDDKYVNEKKKASKAPANPFCIIAEPEGEPETKPEPKTKPEPITKPEPKTKPEPEPEPVPENPLFTEAGTEEINWGYNENKLKPDPLQRMPVNPLFGGDVKPEPNPENPVAAMPQNPLFPADPEPESPKPEGYGNWKSDKDKKGNAKPEPVAKPEIPVGVMPVNPLFGDLFPAQPEPKTSPEPEGTPEPKAKPENPPGYMPVNPLFPDSYPGQPEPQTSPEPEGTPESAAKPETPVRVMPVNPLFGPAQPEPEEGSDNWEKGKEYKGGDKEKPRPEPTPEPKEDSEDLKPLGMNAGCKNPSYKIPAGASTSFEEMDYGSWKNDTKGELMWLPMKGKTVTKNTGPNKAYDGERYIYMEGSRPAKRGDRAILKGPSGLRGCFCVKFMCHMNVDPQTTIDLRVNGKVVTSNRYSHKGWQATYATVDERNDVMLEIVAVRGKTFRGDVGVDDVKVTPGVCGEDEM